MKKTLVAIVLSAMVLMFGGYLSAADQGLVCPLDKNKAKSMMDDMHAKRVDYYTKLLNLTPDQSRKISDIMIEYRDKELAEKDKLLESIINAKNEADGKMKALLTADQLKIYEDTNMKQNMTLSQKMKKWFQSGMCY